MGLRCSLLGHDYGDSFVERDREERGDEVVVTERELKECARCGAEKVTTENTEVRSLQAERSDADGSARQQHPSSGSAGAASADAAAADADDGASGSSFSSPADAIEQAESGSPPTGEAASASADADATVDADADGEDAVILDEDADDAPGSDQWEEPDDVDPDAPAPDPEPSTDDEDVEFVESGPSDDAGTPTDDRAADAAPAGQQAGARASEAASTADDRGRGEWPEREDADDEGFDAAPGGESAESTFEFGDDDEVVEGDTGFTSAGPLETADRTEADDLDYTLYCPECGLEQYAGGSSLRAGDICPECKRGYLAEDR